MIWLILSALAAALAAFVPVMGYMDAFGGVDDERQH